LQGLAQPKRQLSGRTAAAGLTSGYKFKLQGHPRADANAEYVLASVAHTAEQHTYENEFQAFPLNIPFRAARNTPKPRIAGAQTAIVVGKQGEEIWTDKYGRIKVKFHWDQDAARDENASCWVRVSQPSAGKQWGSMQVPRIGHEVVVSFLDGDPDRPLVTGRVYNADMMPPYTLPDNGTQWGWKSNSSKGGGGSNELRFEDKAGEEEVYLHAQHDLNVEVENEATAKITGNETNTNEADYSREVTGNYVLKITGDLTIEATGAISIKSGQDVACEAGGSMTNKAGSMLTNDAGASLMNKAVGALTNRAGGALTNAAGGVQTIGAGGMLVMGSSLVKIEPFNPT
jgi:type VI secretion system secreted protein VgrG